MTSPRLSAHIVVVGLVALLWTACVPSREAGPALTPAAPAATPGAASSLPTGEASSAAPSGIGGTEPIPDFIHAAVDAQDRTPADRALDGGRKPKRWLQFFGIAPGMQLAELGAGVGYSTELLARVVGPRGKVYGQNSKFILERFAEQPWSQRLATAAMANAVRVDREFDSPLPPEVTGLDAVINVLFYHDTVWMKVDRDAMNRAVFRALKPGGVYGIVDHSAKPGAGVSAVQSLHRIEERVVREDLERAGFVFVQANEALRNPEDARDWNASPGASGDRRGTSDRFMWKFIKPETERRPGDDR